jgi:hypothetical protein
MLRSVGKKILNGYEGFRPIWLAVSVSNLLRLPDQAFNLAKPVLANGFAPFKKIIFCNSNTTYVADDPDP